MCQQGRGKAAKQQTKNGLDWEGEREEGVQTLVQVLQLHLHKLWDPPIAEEDFVRYVMLSAVTNTPSLHAVIQREVFQALHIDNLHRVLHIHNCFSDLEPSSRSWES